jgi:Uma2 family endonuclease
MALYDLLLDQDLLADLAELHDDEEEDLVGADWHQDAIRVANDGLLLAGPERGLPWHVGNQLTVLMGAVKGKEWRPCPDLSVHPTLGPVPLISLDTREHGVPALIVEVASERTYRYDLGTKRRTYGQVGVREYLVFDPTRDWLGTAVLAWHATTRGFTHWEAGRDGRWQSDVLGVGFEPQGRLLRVFDPDGVLLPHIGEASRAARERDLQLRERDLQLYERDRQLQEREREADEHRRQLRERGHEAELQQRRIAELESENQRLRGKQP